LSIYLGIGVSDTAGEEAVSIKLIWIFRHFDMQSAVIRGESRITAAILATTSISTLPAFWDMRSICICPAVAMRHAATAVVYGLFLLLTVHRVLFLNWARYSAILI
jgi:hypothetical protein